MVDTPTPTCRGTPTVEIELADPGGRLLDLEREWLQSKFAAALRELGVHGIVRVRLVGDIEMAAAHVRHSGVEGTTDVLTFDLREDPAAGGALETELLLCVDEARRQAAALGHLAERELLLYALHGVLHCMGEDDHDEAAAARMHAREDRVLTAIGVGATFARGENGGNGEQPARAASGCCGGENSCKEGKA